MAVGIWVGGTGVSVGNGVWVAVAASIAAGIGVWVAMAASVAAGIGDGWARATIVGEAARAAVGLGVAVWSDGEIDGGAGGVGAADIFAAMTPGGISGGRVGVGVGSPTHGTRGMMGIMGMPPPERVRTKVASP